MSFYLHLINEKVYICTGINIYVYMYIYNIRIPHVMFQSTCHVI